jgi:hypothetical protein
MEGGEYTNNLQPSIAKVQAQANSRVFAKKKHTLLATKRIIACFKMSRLLKKFRFNKYLDLKNVTEKLNFIMFRFKIFLNFENVQI